MKNKFALIISSIAIIAIVIVSGCGNAEQKKNEVTDALKDLQTELETIEVEATEEIKDTTVVLEINDTTEVNTEVEATEE